jgi:dolichol-phosphate mannosyltransferase
VPERIPTTDDASHAAAGMPDPGLALAWDRMPADLELTVVVPTRNEAGNIDPLIDRLGAALAGWTAELLVVDDSDDDTPRRVLRRAESGTAQGLALRVLHRAPGARAGGLGTAVVLGLSEARGGWVVVMDGDLQHPPELVPELVRAGRRSGADLVVASRHVAGGDAAGLDGAARAAVSEAATRLAQAAFPRRLRGISDPMSGFFAVRPAALELDQLRPEGFKILLEILVRTPRLRTHEVGFVFAPRHAGDSKASAREGLRFARHVLRLLATRRREARRTVAARSARSARSARPTRPAGAVVALATRPATGPVPGPATRPTTGIGLPAPAVGGAAVPAERSA